MPYRYFKEIKTPLSLIKIKFYKDLDTNEFYVKIGKNKRTKLFKN